MPNQSNQLTSKSVSTYRGVLFDLDGTLLDTAKDLGNALNYVLHAKGFPSCPMSTYRAYASDGSKSMLKLGFGESFEQFDTDELIAMFLNHYETHICVETCLFDGVERVLTALNNNAIPWGIVTNKPEYLTDKLLPNFPIFDQSMINISGDTLPQCKPDPAPMHFAADKLGLPPEQILYLGDAERDMLAANNAQMASVVAQYGYIKENEDTKLWCGKYNINHPEQLLAWLMIWYWLKRL